MDTAVTAEDEVTEFEVIDVESIKAVPMGANGFPHLIMKGIAAGPAVKAVTDGKIDQKPDIALGRQILDLLGQAMGNEAQEVSAGKYDETGDVSLLSDAARLVNCWLGHEQQPGGSDWDGVVMASADGTLGEYVIMVDGELADPATVTVAKADAITGAWSYEADDVAKAPREFSADERRKQAKQGNSLPDGSYPIPDADALRRAAILARSKHGNWQAARRLIARRAKELGVSNPLDDDDDSGSKKSAVAEGGTAVDTEGQGNGEALAKSVADAVTKAMEPLKAEIADLWAFKATVEKLPVPGGPVLSAAARTSGAQTAEADDYAAKAALYRAKADAAVTPADREGYRQLAREYDDKAAKQA